MNGAVRSAAVDECSAGTATIAGMLAATQVNRVHRGEERRVALPAPRPAAVPATTTATFLHGPGELTVRVETIIERGPMVGMKSDEKARLNDANDPFLCGHA